MPVGGAYAISIPPAIAVIDLIKTKQVDLPGIKDFPECLPQVAGWLPDCANALLESGMFLERTDLPAGCFQFAPCLHADPADLVCGVDPFCYISHLSAMAYHGLTDRLPTTIYASTPSPAIWKARALERMQRDLIELGAVGFQECLAQGLPKLPTLVKRVPSKLNRQPVHMLSTQDANAGAYIAPTDRPIRVSSIGRTFLDMLRKPDLCGGMAHVLQVYRHEAPTYLGLLVSEIERNGADIDKVRAGYILEERLQIKDNPAITKWEQFARRGGSRVLDPATPYWSAFSEKWCLSLNVINENANGNEPD